MVHIIINASCESAVLAIVAVYPQRSVKAPVLLAVSFVGADEGPELHEKIKHIYVVRTVTRRARLRLTPTAQHSTNQQGTIFIFGAMLYKPKVHIIYRPVLL